MFTIDETQAMLEPLVEELPPYFFTELNGGVNLSEAAPLHRESRVGHRLYILGEYHNSSQMGRYIILYYGSLRRCYGRLKREDYIEVLRRVLRHEFRHHIEALAGERGLEIEDAEEIRAYLARYGDEASDYAPEAAPDPGENDAP